MAEHAEFQVHKLDEDGLIAAADLANIFDGALSRIEEILGGASTGRHAALMRTKLEEACFFAKKALASSRGV
jgi:hypothetical protein